MKNAWQEVSLLCCVAEVIVKMSKQGDAKLRQRFRKSPDTCSNCVNFESQEVTNQYGWTDVRNMRCGIGGFKVNKTNTCNQHTLKE